MHLPHSQRKKGGAFVCDCVRARVFACCACVLAKCEFTNFRIFYVSDKSVVQSIVEQLECEMKMEKTRANEGASGAEQGCGYRKGIVGQ